MNSPVELLFSLHLFLGRYLESIYVPKAVTVLIDSGNDMRSKIPGFLNNDTYIGKAMNMSLEFLKTLTDVNVNEVSADLVNIACFDGSVYTPLMNSTLPAKYNSSQPFSDSLDAVITNGNINPSATGTAADAGVAITKAISTLKSIDSATHLKVHCSAILVCSPVSVVVLLLQVVP